MNGDYLNVPVDRIPALESLLTMVGGRVVYAAGPFARFEKSQLQEKKLATENLERQSRSKEKGN